MYFLYKSLFIFPHISECHYHACALPSGSRSNSVLQPQLRNLQLIALHAMNHPVLFVDAARPKTRECVLQWLGLTNSRIRITRSGLNQFMDALDQFAILLLPVEIVLPGQLCKNESHLANARSLAVPGNLNGQLTKLAL